MVIVGIIAALVIPAIVTSYQNQVLQKGYEREVLAIRGAVDALAVTENKASFFDTIMYVDSKPSGYAESSGKFLKKYLRVAKYCGDSNGNCFAPKYYEYKNKDKILYKPEFDGACASLKNGMSICLKPQIAAAGVEGLLDLNGPKGPNVLGKDLLTFSLESKTRSVISAGTEEVISLNNSPITGACTSCDCDPTLPGCSSESESKPETPTCAHPDPSDSTRCCDTATIISYTDSCCTIDMIYSTIAQCKSNIPVTLTYTIYDYMDTSGPYLVKNSSMDVYLSEQAFKDITVSARLCPYSTCGNVISCTIPKGKRNCTTYTQKPGPKPILGIANFYGGFIIPSYTPFPGRKVNIKIVNEDVGIYDPGN